SEPARDKVPGTFSAARSLRGVRAERVGSGMAVTIAGDGPLSAASIEEARDLPPRLVLDFENVGIGSAPAVVPVNEGDIQRVRVATNSRSPLVTRVVIDLARQMAYRIQEAGHELRVLFGLADETPPAAPSAPATGPAEASGSAPGRGPMVVEPALAAVPVPVDEAAVPAPVAAPQAPAPAPAPPAAEPAPPAAGPAPSAAIRLQPAGGQSRFTGAPVSLDFQGADLRAVLRTFAEISGLNVVLDPSIQGSVDVALRDVPWDQALDIILKANKLGYSVDGTVVRIAPLSVLADEEAERRKLAEAQALAGELQVLTRALSYARAQELVPIVTRSALSQRGEVQVDTRTNTLIIRDLPERLTSAADLITALDRPQPQVEIEARIVQTTRDFARNIGVQWGLNGRLDPALGNTTNLAFPNSASISGRTGGVQGPENASTGVNLPVSGPTSAIGIALGAVNGAFNLDAALSALERSGKGRLLSTPRVSTQNNVEAEMTQGIQIPIQTVANNTVTVTFKDAALTLRVTPQITASDTVIMRIFIENASPDFSRQVNNIPPIDTQRATTSVLVADGETTIIGGIFISREQATQGRVPVLNRIPLLGWLFRRDELADESRELLIFITPRIIKG
ncbi:MAG: type IV pilus secretin PilQ, partial [Acidobacteriota bacterium]